MIVRILDDRLQLITQPDHASLAGRIMEHCVPLKARPRRGAILHAIAEHDNGWAEEDAAPTVDAASGKIADFMTIPVPLRQAVWPRGVSRLADDPWAAALVAHHAATVYDRFRSDGEWTAFFDRMEKERNAMLRVSGVSFDDLLADYPFLRLGDLLSLAFCTNATDEQQFGGWTIRRAGTRVAITPDAFGGAAVPFEIAAREIRNEPFQSDSHLRDALKHARTIRLRGEVTAAG